jgi:hypothetical protein
LQTLKLNAYIRAKKLETHLFQIFLIIKLYPFLFSVLHFLKKDKNCIYDVQINLSKSKRLFRFYSLEFSVFYVRVSMTSLPHVWLFSPFLSGSILNLTQTLSKASRRTLRFWSLQGQFCEILGSLLLKKERSRTGREPVMVWIIIRGPTNIHISFNIPALCD